MDYREIQMRLQPRRRVLLPVAVSARRPQRPRYRRVEPTQKVLTPEQHLESLCPHTPLPAKRWPAPTNVDETYDLLQPLSMSANSICALTAAEMALPVWERWSTSAEAAAEGLSDSEKTAPRRAIETAWKFLRGNASRNDLDAIAAELDPQINEDIEDPDDDLLSIRSALSTLQVSRPSRVSDFAADAVMHMTYALVPLGYDALFPPGYDDDDDDAHENARGEIRLMAYRRWWDLCRCRLAFADVKHAEVSGRSVGVPSPAKPNAPNPQRLPYHRVEPTQQVLTPEQHIESLCPHTPLDAARWPAPVNSEQCYHLLWPLAPSARLVCAATALEMVLPGWDRWVEENRPSFAEDRKTAPRRALELVWQFIRSEWPHESTIIALRAIHSELNALADVNDPDDDELLVAMAVVSVALARYYSGLMAVDQAVAAVNYMSLAIVYEHMYQSGYESDPDRRRVAALEGRDLQNLYQETLRRWWDLCRCRLAFADVEHAEVSGRRVGAPRRPPYHRVEPTQKVLTPEQHLESLCPHTPLPTKRWPAPTNIDGAYRLLLPLPMTAQSICALTAAEMALPEWERWSTSAEASAEGLSDSEKTAPRRAIETAWKFLRGNASRRDMDDIAAELARQINENADDDLLSIRFALMTTLLPLQPVSRDRMACRSRAAETASSAVMYMTYALAPFDPRHAVREDARLMAYRRWWDLCRCRLAFADVTHAEVSGRSVGAMTPDDFAALRTRTQRRVLRSGDLAEIMHPHTAPDLRSFMGPANSTPPEQREEWDVLRDVASQLSPRARVAAALLAVDMALEERFEAEAIGFLDESDWKVPMAETFNAAEILAVVERVRHWLRTGEVSAALSNPHIHVEGWHGVPIGDAISSLHFAAHYAAYGDPGMKGAAGEKPMSWNLQLTANGFISAVMDAGREVANLSLHHGASPAWTREAFLRRWWARAYTMLSLEDVATSDLAVW